MKYILKALALFAGLAAGGNSASAETGNVAAPPSFARCTGCHSVAPGSKSGIGPNLFGLIGKKAGSKPGYAYSTALKASKMRWTKVTLAHYIQMPQTAVPGTKMLPPGLKSAAERDALVAYLASLK